MQDNKTHILLIVVLALGFVLVAGSMYLMRPGEITVSTGAGGISDKSTVSVTGQAQFDVDPDEAELNIRVQTKEPTAKRAQDENARLMSTVKEALKRAGVKDSEMETINYNMWPQQRWDPETQESINDGYMVQHTLKITTEDVTHVGALVETAVSAGANGLDSVNFRLSDKKREDVNSEALAQASNNAKSKAEAIAQGLGVRIKSIVAVSESNVGYDYYYPRPMYAMESAVKAGGSIDYSENVVSPEAVTVSATIGIVYEIE
ncbi:SIMPL domain-containing protein [Candidatus Woesearchaeota archaeon]|nr:SIMPL domain-containing protein [Candidatus Woesearchaeota archaeon]